MEYTKYLGKYASSGDVQTAINDGELNKPYVALVGNSIDYNTLSVSTGYVGMPLTFEITSDGTIDYWTNSANNYIVNYKINDGDWTNLQYAGFSINAHTGDIIQFKGDNPAYSDFMFGNSTAGFIAYGNIMSVISSTNFVTLTTIPNINCFRNYFYGCTGLTDASNLILPATTLTDSCYQSMFDSCTNLTSAPVLPALTLANYCYNSMFCYCSSLNYIKCLATDISATACTQDWVHAVPNSGGDSSSDTPSSSSSDEPVPFEGGTFVKNPAMNDWEFGESGIPNGWTVEDAVL